MSDGDGGQKILLAIARALPLRNLSAGQAMFVALSIILVVAFLALVAAGLTNSPGALLMFFGLMGFMAFGVTR